MPAFYAVHKGRVPGVYTSWSDCEKNVKGFPNANFKKFFKQRVFLLYDGFYCGNAFFRRSK